jgi:D-serine deaminase-like pyridoxal phosphate-dependent protein
MIKNIHQIPTPALIIEKNILERNLDNMQGIANSNGISLRPHIKTHKNIEIARMQIERGAKGIACAKVSEAEVMAAVGFDDIHIPNIIIGENQLERLYRLLKKIKRLTCCVDSRESALLLNDKFCKTGSVIEVFIKIDTGLGRIGLSKYKDILELAKLIHSLKGVRLAGLLTHGGNAYFAKSQSEIESIGTNEGAFLCNIADKLRYDKIEVRELSGGSNPTARYFSKVKGITELRTGNYVFNDMTQVNLGTVNIEQCSLSVLTTVISSAKEAYAVIDAGSKALSLEKLSYNHFDRQSHGYIINKNAVIERVWEEHGLINYEDEHFEIGESIRIIPNHACTVVNLYDFAWLVDGEEVIGKIKIDARGKVV